ncbi:hypothetical protein TRVL_08060 [Trypanosoma vivax]|nr:hypothetical protein TRVL_08060 [Trypanosoma vivax]
MDTVTPVRLSGADRRPTPVTRRSQANASARSISSGRSRFCIVDSSASATNKPPIGTTDSKVNEALRKPALFIDRHSSSIFSVPPCNPKQADHFWSRMREDNAKLTEMHRIVCEQKGIASFRRRCTSSGVPTLSSFGNDNTRHMMHSRCQSSEKHVSPNSMPSSRLHRAGNRIANGACLNSSLRTPSLALSASASQVLTAVSMDTALTERSTPKFRPTASAIPKKRELSNGRPSGVGAEGVSGTTKSRPRPVINTTSTKQGSTLPKDSAALMSQKACRTDTAPYVDTLREEVSHGPHSVHPGDAKPPQTRKSPLIAE